MKRAYIVEHEHIPWVEQQKEILRRKLKGRITRLAVLAGLRVTDVYALFLRLSPLYPRSARRLCASFNLLHLSESRLHWLDCVNPVDAVHPVFAPLHPVAIREERKRQEEAEKGIGL